MYIVALEAQDGTWLDEPESFDTKEQAVLYAKLTMQATSVDWVAHVYLCNSVEIFARGDGGETS